MPDPYGPGVQRVAQTMMGGGNPFGQYLQQSPFAGAFSGGGGLGGMGGMGNPGDFRDAWSQWRNQFLSGGAAPAATTQPTPPGWATPYSGPPPGTGMDTPPAPEIAPPAALMASPFMRTPRPMTPRGPGGLVDYGGRRTGIF